VIPRLQALTRLAWAWLLGLSLLLGGTAGPLWALSDAQQLVVDAWRLVNQSYVDPGQLETLHWKQLRQRTLEQPISTSLQAYDAIETLLAAIGDPYTRLLRPAEFTTLQSNTRGTVSGVGLQLALSEAGRIVVISALEGSPAAEAGILSGSQLLSVDGQPSSELGLEATAAALRGRSGSEVIATLQAPDSSRPREYVLHRREVNLQPVRSRRLVVSGHSLGLLRITQFSESVPEQVAAALRQFNTATASEAPIEGLLLDLRNNSGGLVQAGLAVANTLLDAETIVATEDRGGIQDRQQAGPGSLWSGPMLTLVNGGTASASEILAGALQDDGRSPLLGVRTFGKGLIQTLIPLGDGSGLAVTVARYLTPNGRNIQTVGIEPDRSLPQPEPLNPGGPDDSWLEQAAALLVERIEQTSPQP
jgi:carboxyl-terminal processing protease